MIGCRPPMLFLSYMRGPPKGLRQTFPASVYSFILSFSFSFFVAFSPPAGYLSRRLTPLLSPFLPRDDHVVPEPRPSKYCHR